MKLYDVGEISKREMTPEGFLKVSAKVAKIGMQDYASIEFADSDAPEDVKKNKSIVRLFRSEDEVSDPASLETIESTPVTDGHPKEFVDAKNVKKYQIGFSKPGVRYENGFVLADLVIQDADVIKRVQSGKDQISLGYNSKIKWQAGTDEHYGPFDGIQTQIRVNHIAIVDSGRAGPEVRLDDEQPEGENMPDKTDDKSTDKSVEIVDELKGKVAVLEANLSDAKSEIERLNGALDAATKKIETELNDEALDKKVNERMAFIDRARKLYPDVKTDGKTEAEIKAAAILHINDSFDLEGKSDEYLNGVFETMSATAKETDGVVKDLKDSADIKPSDDARKRFVERGREAHKKGKN
jgi:hypothetical protein